MKYVQPEKINSYHANLAVNAQKMISSAIKDKVVFNRIMFYMPPQKDSFVVEIGVGGGAWLDELHDFGYKNLHGLDIDNYLKDEAKSFIDWRHCDVNCERFPFQDEVVDIIFSFFTFEHLENPWHCVRECTRILKKGGYLILGIPHGFSLWSKLQFLKSGNIAGYRIENNHIAFLPQAVQEKLFFQFSLEDKFYTKPVFPHFPFMNRVLARVMPRKWWGLIANHSFYVYKKID